MATPDLPINTVLPDLLRLLADNHNVVLTAPPGAGKTTCVPVALLGEPWLCGRRILVLEPRRLAARAAAQHMARMRGEPVGHTIGYRMRLDSRIGPNTRIEVVTEGVLTRLLQHDPALTPYGVVLFDEFHERSLHADLGLALCLQSRAVFRPDLRLVVMSATLDCEGAATVLNDAQTVSCSGRIFPVETHYLDHPVSGPIEPVVVQTIQRALGADSGGILVFLPGIAAIRRVERRLQETGLNGRLLCPLHGDLPQEEQDRAIAPAPAGMRKIVLSSSIAETSLTIEDIRIVVDAGLMRVPRFDPRSSLTRLETVPVTQDAADQRRGRAGRTAPGICYRLWTRAAQQQLTPHRVPEMLISDLTSLTLELAQWGVRDAAELAWLDPPPRASLAQARNLLLQLGALDDEGRITDHGTRLAELGLHPRLAHMILSALPIRRGAVACELGALLSERDILKGLERNVDIRQRLDVLRHNRTGSETSVDRAACRRILQSAQQWRRDLAIAADAEDDLDDIGRLLAFAYPDRIAQRQPGPDRRYQLANGRGAAFRHPDPLAAEEFLVVADLDGQSEWARLALAAPISRDQIERVCAAAIRSVEVIEWDDRSQVVRSRQQQRLGALILRDQPISNPDPRRVTHALLEGIRQMGMVCLPWTPDLRQWQARVQFLRRIDQPDSWPDVSDANLVQTLQDWLGPFLNQVTGVETLKRIDLAAALHALLPWQQQQRMDRLAPTHITVPSGSRIRLDYESGDIPILAVRLQEMFGCRDTPRIAEGRAPILLHLLSPAGRPAQVTQDLAGFWATSYQAVRKALRGRYPKHAWPENPLQAIPVKGARRVR